MNATDRNRPNSFTEALWRFIGGIVAKVIVTLYAVLVGSCVIISYVLPYIIPACWQLLCLLFQLTLDIVTSKPFVLFCLVLVLIFLVSGMVDSYPEPRSYVYLILLGSIPATYCALPYLTSVCCQLISIGAPWINDIVIFLCVLFVALLSLGTLLEIYPSLHDGYNVLLIFPALIFGLYCIILPYVIPLCWQILIILYQTIDWLSKSLLFLSTIAIFSLVVGICVQDNPQAEGFVAIVLISLGGLLLIYYIVPFLTSLCWPLVCSVCLLLIDFVIKILPVLCFVLLAAAIKHYSGRIGGNIVTGGMPTPTGSSSANPTAPATAPESQQDTSCVVCYSSPRNIVYLPCKHLVCCESCSNQLLSSQCPMCRKPVREALKVYV